VLSKATHPKEDTWLPSANGCSSKNSPPPATQPQQPTTSNNTPSEPTPTIRAESSVTVKRHPARKHVRAARPLLPAVSRDHVIAHSPDRHPIR
jgi:hypothetical protein